MMGMKVKHKIGAWCDFKNIVDVVKKQVDLSLR